MRRLIPGGRFDPWSQLPSWMKPHYAPSGYTPSGTPYVIGQALRRIEHAPSIPVGQLTTDQWFQKYVDAVRERRPKPVVDAFLARFRAQLATELSNGMRTAVTARCQIMPGSAFTADAETGMITGMVGCPLFPQPTSLVASPFTGILIMPTTFPNQTAELGEILQVLYRTSLLGGWAYVQRSNGQVGWTPLFMLSFEGGAGAQATVSGLERWHG
jgi:hypothetical protein